MQLDRSRRRRGHVAGQALLSVLFASVTHAQVQGGFPSSMIATSDPNKKFGSASGMKAVGSMSMPSATPSPRPKGAPDGADPTPAEAPATRTKNDLMNLYFLLLFLVLVLVVMVYLLLRRRRLAKLRRARDSSQSALARDVENWAPTRTWPAGGWRGMVRRASRVSRSSREEGLDERGEAPPPYAPGRGEDAARALAEAEATALARRDVSSNLLRSQETTVQMSQVPGGPQIGIPLRSMTRWSASASMLPNPPKYESTIVDGTERRRSVGQRRSEGGVLYRMGTNDIIEGQGGNVVELPLEVAVRNGRR